MADLPVRIVALPPMRVATVLTFGPGPELLAWEKLISWAGKKGLLEARQERRIFGFNNPDPSPGSPNYGYEFWITVRPEVESDAEATVKEFPGGRYAVTRCKGAHNITETWQELSTWVENSAYQHSPHQYLEEHLGAPTAPVSVENLLLDLHFPIADEPA